MAMFSDDPVRPDDYQRFARPTPTWYADAKLGVFVHWGPYSVPAWAEPIGPLGAFEPEWWMAHNPYAEWYYNTIRIEGSPARAHQLETYGSDDYEQFLDAWKAEKFDAGAVMDLVKATGARYFVPTTKHHDGVTLWEAPGTGDRNTVRRGPRRDLIAEFRDAAAERGVTFGLYYSGGLDWFFNSELGPITGDITDDVRPLGKVYANYAYDHVIDLIDRYTPQVLWGDIEWPDAGKVPGRKSLIDMFEHFYAAAPEGVVNDRWGLTHWDFRTSEYVHGLSAEGSGAWENCRGVGFSFGYNQLEDASHYLSGPAAITHFVDVVSRGGNFLLNIGLTAAGEVPAIQERTLRELGAFNAEHGEAIFGSRPLPAGVGQASDEPWVRWTASGGRAHAFVLAAEEVRLPVDCSAVSLASLEAVGAEARVDGDAVWVRTGSEVPGRVSFAVRQ
jgi:alpha-L-fucosidase